MDPTISLAEEAAVKAANLLIEHCDGCIVLMSGVSEDGHTVFIRRSKGNLHAVEGAIREHLRRQEGYHNGYNQEIGRRDSVRDLT